VGQACFDCESGYAIVVNTAGYFNAVISGGDKFSTFTVSEWFKGLQTVTITKEGLGLAGPGGPCLDPLQIGIPYIFLKNSAVIVHHSMEYLFDIVNESEANWNYQH